MRRILRKGLPIVLVIGLALGFVGFAYAVIPDSQGVIHGCYRTSNGSLRIIDSDIQTCNGSETEITWNQTGPQGPPGPAGPGAVLSNRLVVPQDGTEQQFLTLPNLGDVYTICSTTNLRWKFVNTSTQSVFVVNSQAEVLPGNSYITDTPRDTFLFSLGNGSGSTVATMTISQSVQPQPCTYTALATIDTN